MHRSGIFVRRNCIRAAQFTYHTPGSAYSTADLDPATSGCSQIQSHIYVLLQASSFQKETVHHRFMFRNMPPMSDKPDLLDYNLTSHPVQISLQERLGFGEGFQLRRHNNTLEAKANQAIHSARRDWHRYIGPIETFGNANPYHGNGISIALPLTLPDRVAAVAYLFECWSLQIEKSRSELLTFYNYRRFPIRRYMRVGKQVHPGKSTVLPHFGGAWVAYLSTRWIPMARES